MLLTLACAGFGACQDFSDDTAFKPTTPELSFVESALQAGKATGEYKLTIKSNLPWRIKSDKDWVSFDPAYGDGDAEVTVAVGANRTLDPRTATISVYVIKGEEVSLTLTQEAASASDLATNYYVKADGDAANDGLSWAKATTMEKALELAMNGDFIHVAAGRYVPTVPLTGVKTDADKTFEIHSNFTMIGGYPADAAEGAVADPEKNETILDGDKKAYHVVCVTAQKMTGMRAVVDGFTITGGSANFGSAGGPTIGGVRFYNTYGSAVFVGNSAVDIVRCKIKDNTDARTGAIRVDTGAEALFSYCEIKNNACRDNGSAYNSGAFWIADCTLTHIDHTTIANNKTTGVGVGVYILGTGTTTNVLISNSTVSGQSLHSEIASRAGGGIYTREYGNVVIINSTVYGNHCGRGAGIAVHGTAAAPSKTYVINCTVAGNSDIDVNYGPGLLQNAAPATIEVYNTLIAGNTEADGTESNVKLQSSNNKIVSSIVGSTVYDAEGAAIPGVLFEFAKMLGTLADNGGATQSCVLLGDNNPARQYGMTVAELENLCAGLDPIFGKVLGTIDQLDASRDGKTVIGAVVK